MLRIFWFSEWLTFCAIVSTALRAVSGIKTCTKDMIEYEFTDCKENGRWKVAVPKSHDCELATPEAPVYQKNCDLTCSRGEFLDAKSKSCSKCPAGTYSLGNGFRFDRWDDLPEGFTISKSSSSFPEFGYHPKVFDCSESGWTPRGDYVSSGIDDCSSSMTYLVDIKTKGSLSFTYQNTDEDMIFHFFIRNSECKVSSSSQSNRFLGTTGATWKRYSVSLEKGKNLITWKTTGLLLGGKTELRPALIKEIEIIGVSFTTKCHPCKPGYHSAEEQSDWCQPCPAGTNSKAGQAECTQCDAKGHYSYVASPECLVRPPCTSNDYFETLSHCENGLTKASYEWSSPKICRDDVEDSIKLPASGIQKACPPCNPGFFVGKSGCEPCADGEYSSDGNSTCKTCTVGSHPIYGFFYNWWGDRLPSNMGTSCLTIHNETCLGTNGWTTNGGMVTSSSSEIPVAYLLLKMQIFGFRSAKKNAGGNSEYGRLNFVFELKCFDDCVLYLMKNVIGGHTRVLASWHKKTGQSSFEYVFNSNETMNITWAYQKTSMKLHEDEKYSDDMAIIYSINVTNAVKSPAVDCIECGGASDNSGCIPCRAGHHIEESKKACVKCPENSILPHETIQSENCTHCSEGTKSNDAQTACKNDCVFHSLISNRSYEFPELLKTHVSASPPSFSGGHKYIHYYNFSICGNDGFGNARCSANSTDMNPLYSEVSGMICRSTEFTSIGDEAKDVALSYQPQLIASVLKGIHEDLNVTTPKHAKCPFDMFPTDEELPYQDIIYEYAHPTAMDDCPHGYATYVRLRCNPDVPLEDSTIKMPKDYPEGSCDGCNFHFLWESESACPKCEDTDYYTVKSGCEDGYTVTKHLWHSYPKSCKGGSLPEDKKTACTDVKLYVEMGVLAGVALIVFMLVVIFMFWRRNRTLEYKYQRLVVNSDGNSNLKAADSCAMSASESEDSDDEAVVFRKKRAKMMKKDETVPLNRSQNFVKM